MTAPTVAQAEWLTLKEALFVHFGPNTFRGVAWGDGSFPAEQFAPTQLNCRQWADMAAEAGMKYAVLTAKHHDGFCLWPTRHTPYSVANSPSRPDVVAQFVEAMRNVGIRPGLYYSLWDRNFPHYEDDAAYADFMQAQVTELLTDYGPLVELWFDGGWDKEHPTRKWDFDPAWANDSALASDLRGYRWQWRELYALIHGLQPDCLVINNSSSDRPGKVRYHPVDVRTAEHFDFVYNGELCVPDLQTEWETPKGETVFLPLEFCTSFNPDWFYIAGKYFVHPSRATIAGWRETARRANANLLLNIGPTREGLLPEVHRAYLRR